MIRANLILAMLLCVGINAFAETNSPAMIQGDLISKHLPALEMYGDGKSFLATPASVPGKTEVMMWRIGDGILAITTSIGAGIITDMSYIVRSDGGKGLMLTVKEFNPKTGEMTIMVPSNPSESNIQ